MIDEEFEKIWKESSFSHFEHNADLINHPLTEEEQAEVAFAESRVSKWTSEWFDDDEDPDDDGTTDPVGFARLERELAALRLRLEQKQLSEAGLHTLACVAFR